MSIGVKKRGDPLGGNVDADELRAAVREIDLLIELPFTSFAAKT